MVKLPLLIVHFLNHKEHNNKITFADFIVMHYVLADDGVDSDTAEDKKLPFKSFIVSDNSASIEYTPTLFLFSIVKLNNSGQINFVLFDDSFLPFLFHSVVWQPPKSV